MYFVVLDKLNGWVRSLLAILLATMCLFALLQVVVRLGLNQIGIVVSAPWSEEIGRFAMIWMIFLGVAYAFRSGQMVALRLLVERIPGRLRTVAEAGAAFIVLGFAALLFKVGLQASEFGWLERSPVLQLEKAYVYLAMPVSAALIFLNTLSTFVEGVLSRRGSPAVVASQQTTRSKLDAGPLA